MEYRPFTAPDSRGVLTQVRNSAGQDVEGSCARVLPLSPRLQYHRPMHIIDLKTAPGHLPQLAAWHHAQWAHLNPGRRVDDLAAQMREYLNDAALPRMLIAEENGELLGSSSIVASDMDNHPELGPWLANVYVPAAHRGRGLGTALVRAAMALARAQGLGTLYLFTHDQEGFYRALGWTTLGHEDYRGDRVTLMQYRPAA